MFSSVFSNICRCEQVIDLQKIEKQSRQLNFFVEMVLIFRSFPTNVVYDKIFGLDDNFCQTPVAHSVVAKTSTNLCSPFKGSFAFSLVVHGYQSITFSSQRAFIAVSLSICATDRLVFKGTEVWRTLENRRLSWPTGTAFSRVVHGHQPIAVIV